MKDFKYCYYFLIFALVLNIARDDIYSALVLVLASVLTIIDVVGDMYGRQ